MDGNDWKWFHPSISRIDCERLLEKKKCGTFLVRKSESSQSDLVLSLSSGTNLFHYRIKCSNKGLYLHTAEGVPQLYFSSCNELIQYYKKADCGLPFVLGSYIPVIDGVGQRTGKNVEGFDPPEDEIKMESIAPFFNQQLSSISEGQSDVELRRLVSDYIENGVDSDWHDVHSGLSEPPQLKRLLALAAADVQRSLDIYLKRLDVIKELFAFGSEDYMEKLKEDVEKNIESSKDEFEDRDNLADLDLILQMLNTCQTSIFKLEQKACKVLKETGGTPQTKKKATNSNMEVQYSPLPVGISSAPSERVSRGEHIFEVTSGHMKNKSILLLHVINGKFYVLKSKNDDLSTAASFNCSQVLQLVKSKSYKTKLNIVTDQTNKQYTFQNYKSRELFCQRVQQMKIAHSIDIPTKELSIFIGTWNMGDTPPPDDLSEWYKCFGLGKTKADSFSIIPSDIFVFGTQESALQEKEWIGRIKSDIVKLFSHDFKMVTSCSLWGIRLVIFIRSSLMNSVNSVKTSSVRTGIANTLGNKGAVGISFNIGSTSFCFVNCHLTSGSEKLERRNQNFHAILRGLNLGQGDTFDILHSFHHFFWFGDLNYRIELEIADIIKYIMENKWGKLIASDQLSQEIKKGNAFLQLDEEDLTFRPTYRYFRGTHSTYVWTKQKVTGDKINVPSWCDRVLWKSYPHLTSVNTAYGCTQGILTSDHAPVFASFDVSLLSETLSTLSCIDTSINKTSPLKIAMVEAVARILSNSCTQFILEFHSTCLEKTYTSRVNSLENYEKKIDIWHQANVDHRRGYAYPWWVQGDLIELVPILHDPNYLKDQHILIAVKGNDGQESCGECIISLQPLLSGAKQTIEKQLTHLGSDTGFLKLVIQLNLPAESKYLSSNFSKIYELISVADEDSGDVNQRPSSANNQRFSLVSDEKVGVGKEDPHLSARQKKKELTTMQFQMWVKSIGYECYFKLLVTNGYDDLDYFCSITHSDLRDIGIGNEEHIDEIVRHAGCLSMQRRSLYSV